jgi:hypothetical protein
MDDFAARLVSELGAEHLPLPLDGKSVVPIRELRSLVFIGRTVRRLKSAYVFNFTVKMNMCGDDLRAE